MGEVRFCGIQQIGIGVSDLHAAWGWYRKYFGMDIRVFEDTAEAALMTKFTGGKAHFRHAALAMNLQGGGGLEIWQYRDRTPLAPEQVSFGQKGIFAARMKCTDVVAAHDFFVKEGLDVLSQPMPHLDGSLHFYLRDPFGNVFDMVSSADWFCNEGKYTGGCSGAVIGVSDMDASLRHYGELLGYDEVLGESNGHHEDLVSAGLDSGTCRRVLLGHSQARSGGFARLLGATQIELVQLEKPEADHIYADRYWGDLGFIHLCFDVKGMQALREASGKAGSPFLVDSRDSFDMGEASGHFSYIQDPDGTLIEFVETHKLPIIKKLGWNLDLRNRAPDRDLPRWLVKMLRLSRVRD